MASTRRRRREGVTTELLENSKLEANSVSRALQNHLILQRVASFLLLSDLKNIRLVNRQWNQDSLSTVRRNVHSIRLNKHQHCSNQVYRAPIKSFLELVKNSKFGFPCVSFEIDTILLDINKRLFYNFMATLSKFVISMQLDIKHDRALNEGEMAGITFPKLKTLLLLAGSYENYYVEALICFENIVRNSPVLEKVLLKVHNINGEIASKFIQAIGTSPNVQNLTELHLEIYIDDAVFLNVAKIPLRLKKLSVKLPYFSEFPFETFKSWLDSQCNSLEELNLTELEIAVDDLVAFSFPRLEKLKTLEFEMTQMNIVGVPFSQLFPALKHLKLACFNERIDGQNEILISMKPMDTVESLTITDNMDQIILDQVAKVFPKLKNLKIQEPAITPTNGIAWRGMVTLEELTVSVQPKFINDYGVDSFNEALTGYKMAELKNIENAWMKTKKLTRVKRNRKPTYIFEHLKVLRVNNTKFTDVLCLLGPMKMASLQCLDLLNSPESRISGQVLKQMRGKCTVLIQNKCVI